MRSTRQRGRTRQFFEIYAKDLTGEDLQRLFTRDTREAYRFFARDIDRRALARLPWLKRQFAHARLFLRAVMLRLSPARRALYGVALVFAILGMFELFEGVRLVRVPAGPFFVIGLPTLSWVEGAGWFVWSLILTNLLLLLELADRLSLKHDLEIARQIQQAMLPSGTYAAAGAEAVGVTQPANTVGGDFYDILPQPDGRIVFALGDVVGKGSPAALLMALLLAVLRTLVDEGLEGAALLERLNTQICRHSPPSRFITLFYALYDPTSGCLTYVNAGHLPALVHRRSSGRFERLAGGGVALGMFEGSRYEAHQTALAPGDLVVAYSDGITEAEDPAGRPFEEAGLERAVESAPAGVLAALGTAILAAVERHAQDTRFADDLTVLLLRRPAGAAS